MRIHIWAERQLGPWSLDISAKKSQRDFAPKPRVASCELPWETVRSNVQPQRGCVIIPSLSFKPIRPDGSAGASSRNPVRVVRLFGHLPRVARASQPWALRWNPFGIQDRMHRRTLLFLHHAREMSKLHGPSGSLAPSSESSSGGSQGGVRKRGRTGGL